MEKLIERQMTYWVNETEQRVATKFISGVFRKIVETAVYMDSSESRSMIQRNAKRSTEESTFYTMTFFRYKGSKKRIMDVLSNYGMCYEMGLTDEGGYRFGVHVENHWLEAIAKFEPRCTLPSLGEPLLEDTVDFFKNVVFGNERPNRWKKRLHGGAENVNDR